MIKSEIEKLVEKLLNNTTILRDVVKEAVKLDVDGVWPRNSYILMLAYEYAEQHQVGKTTAIKDTLEAIRRAAFKRMLQLESSTSNLVDDGK